MDWEIALKRGLKKCMVIDLQGLKHNALGNVNVCTV